MHQVREFVNFIDVVFGTFWGFTVIDIAPSVVSGSLFLNSLDNILKVAISIVGVIYAIVRIVILIKKSRLDSKYRIEEIESLKNQNFNFKFKKEFIDPFKEQDKK